jgi:hypothetical protein
MNSVVFVCVCALCMLGKCYTTELHLSPSLPPSLPSSISSSLLLTLSPFLSFQFFFFNRILVVAKAGLEFSVLLPQFPKC